ncbi:hypothetical protein [Rhodoplanes roseus]|uniref:DUF2946 domain-containing protein n=1 Tax=Rhodoplanes roseus TaxID=29409 RepID=A0A327L179_9BRAD|nr:hypothetical protein [Rhodoplanes roseus]RAI44201.1 hypothetical protein CH341_10350 [Rhodoplanes roseus]
MVRLLRQTVAVLVALAWMIGNVLPVVPADAAVAAPSAVAAVDDGAMHHAMAGAMPCHEDGAVPAPDTGKAKPCPAVALCAKCFQALPTLTAPAIRAALQIAAVTGSSDQQAESLSPAPPRKPPRA